MRGEKDAPGAGLGVEVKRLGFGIFLRGIFWRLFFWAA